MARYVEPTPEQLRGWKAWVEERPPHVRAVAERFEPWSLYRMISTGQRVTMVSFSENETKGVTLTVAITGEFNLISHDRAVFGIDPDDLVPCDLPGPSEAVGSLLSPEQVEDNIDLLRVMVRPDLWVLDSFGKAIRKN